MAEELVQSPTEDVKEAYFKELITLVKATLPSKERLMKLKRELRKKHHLSKVPTDIEVLLHAEEQDFETLKPSLLTKPTRSISGVAPVAVMTKPLACPHGRCIFCPGGPGSVFGDVPQSYTGKEPSTLRAIRAHYDAYLIVMNRLEQYVVTGHVPDKVEIILQGGTFPADPEDYQEEVITDIFQAMNDFSTLFFNNETFDLKAFKAFFELPHEVGDSIRTQSIQEKLRKIKQERRKSQQEAQKENETAKIRCDALVIETKPDWGFAEHGNRMLDQGCTKVELGVQTVYDNVLKITHRGHTLEDTKKSIQELKDLGFKLHFHYMLGLPQTTKDMDEQGLKEIFENPDYKPDMLKIYPCMVMRGTPLFTMYERGFYKPLTTQEAAEIIAEAKRYIPHWCRITRIQRDIPTYVTSAGVDRTNLRQYVQEITKKKGIHCCCIRCRESGKRLSKRREQPLITYHVETYEASGGTEFFISAEDKQQDMLFGYCRLRFPSTCLRKQITPTTALIRELHVYSPAVELGKQDEASYQHRGIGKQLMQMAEDIAKQHAKNKLLVIAGIGARAYFQKLGYLQEGPYMAKTTP